jgi:hypothetical protein
MSLENNLASIAKSLELIAAALTQKNANPTPVAAPAQPVSVPVAAVPAQPVPVAASVMPALPVFTPAAPIPTALVMDTPVPVAVAAPTPAVASPFSDKNAMMDFVMTSYRALGAEKGAKIQDVLTAIGYKNINDVPVEKWADLKAGVEALK